MHINAETGALGDGGAHQAQSDRFTAPKFFLTSSELEVLAWVYWIWHARADCNMDCERQRSPAHQGRRV